MGIDKKKLKKFVNVSMVTLGTAYVGLSAFAKKKKGATVYENLPEEKNLNAGPVSMDKKTIYDKYLKRIADKTLSFGGLVVLSPLYALLSLAIFIDDPGPVLFSQKRVGQNKEYFKLYKFRSMKMSTPHDTPTHLLENPEQYITRVGKILRKYSLDELPQIWNIFIGNMSIIGPRPALWNQDDLVAERDKYGANDVKPGLTGWAQINGRDELEIPVKAKLDGEYVAKLRKGSLSGIIMDAKCFFGTITSVLRHDGVVEGGTGEIKKAEAFKDDVDSEEELTLSIVTYNSAEEISTLMESLKTCNYFDKMKVYIVDNASSDNTVEILRKDYPWAYVFESKENLGFGKGHNIVINHVKSKYHIIVNPDIRVDVDTFNKAIEYMDANPDVVVVTPFVLNTDGTQQFLPKKNPSMKYMIGGMFENYSKICKKLREEYTLQNKDITKPIDVEFCSGCFMITRTEALHQVGGFDDIYFLHFEDADLTRELRKVGRAVYNPDITVTHKWERDNKKINKSFAVALKSMFIYMKKWNKNSLGGVRRTSEAPIME